MVLTMVSEQKISVYSQLMTDYDGLLSSFIDIDKDEDVEKFSKHPLYVLTSGNSHLFIVNSRAACYNTIDRCEFGCWRIMARDRLIKCKYTGKILGFKRILKFCLKNKRREIKRSLVMEEYRFKKNQDQAMCKFQVMYEAEINVLIYKHFSSNYYKSSEQQKKDESYLEKIIHFYEKPMSGTLKISNQVYELDPLKQVNLKDDKFRENGTFIFAMINSKTYENWMILEDNGRIKSKRGEIIGYKRVLQFYETEKRRIVCDGKEIKGSWIIEEYRLLADERNVGICVIKLMNSYSINSLLIRSLGEY